MHTTIGRDRLSLGELSHCFLSNLASCVGCVSESLQKVGHLTIFPQRFFPFYRSCLPHDLKNYTVCIANPRTKTRNFTKVFEKCKGFSRTVQKFVQIFIFISGEKLQKGHTDSTRKINQQSVYYTGFLKHFCKISASSSARLHTHSSRCTSDTRERARARTPRKFALESERITFVFFPSTDNCV